MAGEPGTPGPRVPPEPWSANLQSPAIWPPPLTYRDMRRLATDVLPGARYRRHLYWRYSQVWAKP
jgi:hypothetical protein